MKVKFKKLRENAKLPTKAHEDDFCYDVYACDCEEVAPNVYRYPLGFALQIDENEGISLPDNHMSMWAFVWQNHKTILSIDFRPRSSIYKTGMVLCNSVGTGDRPYTGEYWAYFYHVMPNMPKYEPGDRVAQMKIGFTVPIEFVEVDEFNDTERGDGGFGSSGLR